MNYRLLLSIGVVSSLAALGLFWFEAASDERPYLTHTHVAQPTAKVKETSAVPELADHRRDLPAPNDALQAAQATLAKRQAALEKELHSLREELQQALVMLDERKQPAPIDEPASALQEVTPELSETKLAEHLAQLDSILQAQYPDPNWSPEAEDALFESVGGFLVDNGAELVDAECRHSVCRIETFHDDPQSLSAFFEDGLLAVPWDYESVTKVEHYADGTASVITMISREGHMLSRSKGG